MNRFFAPVLALLVMLAGCSKPSANEYFSKAEAEYTAAKKNADTLQNREGVARLFEPALENYMKVIREYPDDPLAERAAFMTATIRNNELRDPEQAVVYYKLYANKYPDADKAPTATFLVAYLYHNDLHLLDSAETWYKRFLDRYPQHEMAVSAQFELNSLGKPADQLLPEDSTTDQKQGMTTGEKAKKTAARQHPM